MLRPPHAGLSTPVAARWTNTGVLRWARERDPHVDLARPRLKTVSNWSITLLEGAHASQALKSLPLVTLGSWPGPGLQLAG